MRHLTGHLNDMREKGYKLSHILEQDGNTEMVFEWVGVPGS